jgi:Tol biopolymer transport system component
VLATVLLGGAGPAGAAFPGANGEIAFGRTVELPPAERESPTVFAADLYVIEPGGSGEQQLGPTGSRFPSWSADGTKVAFARTLDPVNEGAHYTIWTMNADGSGAHQTTSGGGQLGDVHPSWSPDGTKTAFMRGDTLRGDIWVTNADGSGAMPLTASDPDADSEPAWSPGGTKIAFVRNGDIWVMNADGSSATQLTSGFFAALPGLRTGPRSPSQGLVPPSTS